MVRQGILLGHCAEQSKWPAPHHLGGGGGGGTLQARPGPRLRSRLARTSLRGGRAPGSLAWPRRAGPDAWGGGGGRRPCVPRGPGVALRPPSPAPVPRAPPTAASGPAPPRARRGPRCSLANTGGLAPPVAPSPPWGGGGGAPSRAAPGRGGGGLAASCPAAGLRPRRGRPVLRVTHPHPRPPPAPRRPRWSLPPRRWSSELLAEAQAGSRAGTSRCIRFVLLAVRGAVCGRRRPPLEEADGVSWCPLRLGQPRAVGPPLGLAGQGGECCAGAGVSPPGGARSWPAGGAPPCWSRRLGCSGAVRCT